MLYTYMYTYQNSKETNNFYSQRFNRLVCLFVHVRSIIQVHQTYQVMYIQEVILPTPSLFEENMMSALNSFVLFNKAEIINTIQVRGGVGSERS